MNRFEYRSTVILKSDFDFIRLEGGGQIQGNAEVSSAIGIPKNLEENKSIRCMIEMKLDGERDDFHVYIKTISDFGIIVLDNEDQLIKDAKEFCTPRTMDELSERLNRLISIQLGQEVNIPIPPFSVE